MSNTVVSGSEDKRCRSCNILLIPEENWAPANIKAYNTICKECDTKKGKRNYQKRKLKQTPEQRKLNKIQRIRDEPRIERMTEFLKEYNVRYYMNHQEQLPIELQNKQLKYEDIQDRKRPELEAIPEIILRYKINIPEEGDTAKTWMIALHECGYRGYDLDDDGLPIARPGVPAAAYFRRLRKAADTKYAGKGGRIGIVCLPVKEIPRRPKSEWRIFLLTREEDYKELDKRRRVRHSRENEQMVKLRLAMDVSTEQKLDIIDALVGIWDRT
jgi:hypothetical protein